MMRISRPHLLDLARRLEDFQQNGVFTAQHRYDLVGDAAAALRAVASEQITATQSIGTESAS